jgi:hypothetical protein
VRPFRFRGYHTLGDTPNVVVDGSPTASTRLTLSHWPGSPTPTELLDDLSAQIVFRAIERPHWLEGLDVVSNNHFDQDGLASAYALVHPEDALARRDRVIDVASAGDFATFRDRDSMRIAMAIAAHDDPARSPLAAEVFAHGYEEQCAALYEALLPRFTELLDHPERSRPLWEAEDAHLTDSLAALDDGRVSLHDEPTLDLAVCVVPESWAERAATRFTVERADALHPAALPNRTERMRLLVSHGRHHRVELRYETWVMYRSRELAPRPDLRLLAARLDELEGRACWRADAPGALTPALRPDDAGSDLTVEQFTAAVREFLSTAAPAWDPFAAV